MITISELRPNVLPLEIPIVKRDLPPITCYYPTLKGLGLALLLGLATVTIIVTSPIGLFFIPILIAGTLVLLPFFKQIVFEISLIFTRITAGKDNWMHQILKNLFLGAIPLNDYDHVQEFKAKNIGKIVSLIEAFEQNSKTFGGTPVSYKQWEDAHIEQILVETSDFSTPSKVCLKRAVAEIRAGILAGKNVYVHCKAGRGRSATAIICYLLEYEMVSTSIGMDEVESAIRYVKNIRSQISLNENHKRAVIDYFSPHPERLQ